MLHVAIVGSGPAGFYTAEACRQTFGGAMQIDIIDRLPVPYGLIRSGVAPDHQSIKAVARRYEAVAQSENVRFVGNVAIGQDVSVDELLTLYDGVVLATGAPVDRPLDISGADLPGAVGSAAFVGWYNGHPDFAGLDPPLSGPGAVIVGNGNVALDVARILAKTREEFAGSDIATHAIEALDRARVVRITLLGRRGPHQIAMTPKELGELTHLARAQPHVDTDDLPEEGADALLEPGVRKSVSLLRAFAASAPMPSPISIDFDFFAVPVAIEGDGHVERVVVARTTLDTELCSVVTDETYVIPASLVVTCIGYRTPPIAGVPYEHGRGRFANVEGRIVPGLYCVGWARRGPSGTIGTNRPDGYLTAEHLAEDLHESEKAGGGGLDRVLRSRGVQAVSFSDWKRIEAAETDRARSGTPREKFTSIAEMMIARA